MRESLRRTAKAALFEFELARRPPVLVYQMGKVGSSSVFRSLQECYDGVVLHSHHFAPQYHRWKIGHLYRRVVFRRRPIKIISLTREPIGRNISAFFQVFERVMGVDPSTVELTSRELRDAFLSRFIKHESPLHWFDTNIRNVLGIDVYSRAFPRSGTASYCRGGVDLLVLRSEIADEEKAAAIGDFLGLSRFEITRVNEGAKKSYAELYQRFKAEVKLPEHYVDKMCGSKYFGHFYSPETISATRARWSERRPVAHPA